MEETGKSRAQSHLFLGDFLWLQDLEDGQLGSCLPPSLPFPYIPGNPGSLAGWRSELRLHRSASCAPLHTPSSGYTVCQALSWMGTEKEQAFSRVQI